MKYTTRTVYNIEALQALTKAQFKIYGKWQKILMRSAGMGFIILGMMGQYGQGANMALLLCGVLAFMSVINMPKRMAKKMLRSYKGNIPKVEFSFQDGIINVTSGGSKGKVRYKDIAYISEYGEYILIFIDRSMAYIVNKSNLSPNDEEGFKAGLTRKTGKEIIQVNEFNFSFGGRNISM